MSARLRFALRDAWASLFRSGRASERGERGKKEVIEGTAGNVIIVKSPNTEYFKEAIFILCDDLFSRGGTSREQLLREARRAAADYTAARTPPRSAAVLTHALFFLLGALVCCAVLLLFGI